MELDFALSRGDLDSETGLRESVDVRALLRGEGGRLILARHPAQFAVDGDALLSWEAAPGDVWQWWWDVPDAALWFMGRSEAGVAQVVVSMSQWRRAASARAVPDNGFGDLDWRNLMDFAPDLGDAADSLVATQASALLAWHDATRFCHLCGNPLVVESAGWTLKCSKCGHTEYPRTDPAVIVAVLDARDRLLLLHNVQWPTDRMSLLAGFVDAGESAEHAVRREVMEEVGLRVRGMEYLGSQPWPRPRSLMLAYKARVKDGRDPRADQVEVDRARFFTREELLDSVEAGDVVIPGPASVAYAVINLWLEGNL